MIVEPQNKNCKVTQNLVLELKYDTVSKNKQNKTGNNLPGRAGHWHFYMSDWVSYLPQVVGQSLYVIPCII